MEYQYPIDYHWSTQEIVDVINFFQQIESVYEKGLKREVLMSAYRRFKEIVPSKAEEKKLCNEFQEISGYSSYKAIKMAKESEADAWIKL